MKYYLGKPKFLRRRMAGAGVRVFLPGEVLTATLVNTYLQDQVVAIFDTSTARNAAFGNIGNLDNMPELVEGRVCYLRDTNDLQYYSGVAWVSISEGSLVNTITAKGDIFAGTAAGAVDNVAVGTNDYLLVADSSTATGVKWGQITLAGIPDALITNAKINASAAIADTKLGTIATAGKVSNSATTATDANTNSTIVARDASGNFSAGTVSVTSASVSGRFDGTTVREVLVDASVSASVVTADYSTGDIFYVGTAPSSNFTVNLTNAPTDNGKVITVVLFVTQGSTGYYPNVVQVAGSAQTIKWANSAAPIPTSSAGKIDIFSFTFVRRSSAWTVFGSSNLGY
jgi:hypothetical protein